MYIGIDLGTSAIKMHSHWRRRPHDRDRIGAAAGEPAQARILRAGPGELVAGDPRRLRRARQAGAARDGGRARHRPVRPAAWRDPARQGRQRAASLHPVERRALGEGVPTSWWRACPTCRASPAIPTCRLHRAQAGLGEEARARDLRAGRQGAAAQGLSALPAERRVHRGHVRRLRHLLARCRQARLVEGRAGGDRHVARSDAGAGRRHRAGRDACARSWRSAGACRSAPVIAGGAGDNAAGAIALGAIKPGDAFVSLGTSGVLWATTAGFAPNTDGGGPCLLPCVPNTWHQMGVILSAAACLSWLAGVVGVAGGELLEELGDTAERPSPVLFLPYLSGERTPHNDADVRGAFAGLSHDTARGTLTQAVLEGVAFALRDCLEALAGGGHAAVIARCDRRRRALAAVAHDHRQCAGPAGRPPGRQRGRRRHGRRAAGPHGGDRRAGDGRLQAAEADARRWSRARPRATPMRKPMRAIASYIPPSRRRPDEQVLRTGAADPL